MRQKISYGIKLAKSNWMQGREKSLLYLRQIFISLQNIYCTSGEGASLGAFLGASNDDAVYRDVETASLHISTAVFK